MGIVYCRSQMNNTATLTTSEISNLIGDFTNVIELAVLDVIEHLPSAVFALSDDLISAATVAVMESLRTFQRRYLSISNVTTWVRQRARWTTMNAVKRICQGDRYVRACGTMARATAAVDTRAQDAGRLAAALAVLTDESRVILTSIMGGQKATDVAKRLGLSMPTITRRKQSALASVTAAMAA